MEIKSIRRIGSGYACGTTIAVIAQKCPDFKTTTVEINEAGIDNWNDQDSSKLSVYKSGLDSIVFEASYRKLFSFECFKNLSPEESHKSECNYFTNFITM